MERKSQIRCHSFNDTSSSLRVQSARCAPTAASTTDPRIDSEQQTPSIIRLHLYRCRYLRLARSFHPLVS